MKRNWCLLVLVFLFYLPLAFGQIGRSRANYPSDELLKQAEERIRVVLVSNPKIFGLDLLGWGIDLAIGRPEEAIKVPVFKWEWTENNTYVYPLEPNTTFHVPDDVYVRTVAEMYAKNKVFESGEEYVLDLLLDLGLGIKSANNTGGGQQSDPVGGGGSANVSSLDLSAFSGDANIRYQYSKMENQSSILIVNGLESGLWQLVIGPSSSPRDRIQQNIEKAQLETDPEAFFRFISLHGTHYIESVVVGGNVEMSSLVERSDEMSAHDLSILANAEFRNLFGLGEVQIDLTVNFTENLTAFKEETNNWMKSQGGDPELANFFSGTLKPEETFILWSKTLIANPAVIRFRLREISWLFDLAYRKEVSNAVSLHLSGKSPV